MEFKQGVEVVYSEDVYYDLFFGGYLDPENFLVKTSDKVLVEEAIRIVEDYVQGLEDEGILEVG